MAFLFITVFLLSVISFRTISNQNYGKLSFLDQDKRNIIVKNSNFNIYGNISIYIREAVSSEEIYKLISYDLKNAFGSAVIKNYSMTLKNNFK
ncbi:MAG: hypothetical protein ACTSQO_06950 [Candidatus Helarchaeota archaeon]